jgi:hypothetical protein
MGKEFAPGLPSRTEYAPINQKGRTRLVIQKHIADKAGRHYDMRLKGPGGVAHSWVIRSLPGERDKTLAIRQPTHTAKYMDFQGKIESGYGAGTVTKAYDQKVRVLSATNDRIKMVLPEGTFTMIKPKNFGSSDKNWLMIKNAAYIDELQKIAVGMEGMRMNNAALKPMILRTHSNDDMGAVSSKNLKEHYNNLYGDQKNEVKNMLSTVKRFNKKGLIVSPNGGGFGSINRTLNKSNSPLSTPGMDAKNLEMTNRMTLAHEGRELKPYKKVNYFSHQSPSVVLGDHNVISTLPKEYNPSKTHNINMRQSTGEVKNLNRLLPGFKYGESPRLSRHAIKRMSSIIEAKQKLPLYGVKQIVSSGAKLISSTIK